MSRSLSCILEVEIGGNVQRRLRNSDEELDDVLVSLGVQGKIGMHVNSGFGEDESSRFFERTS